MPKRPGLLAACIFALFLCARSHAAPTGFSIDVWDTDAGLPQNSVITMIRTQDGYLWLGTVNGLVRFDGIGRRTSAGGITQFPVFDERNTPALGSSLTVKVFEDSQHNLWIGTETAGVIKASASGIEKVISGSTRESRLVSITEDLNGVVWLFTADGQLGKYSDGKFQVWHTSQNYPSLEYRAVVADRKGALLLATDHYIISLDKSGTETNGAPKVLSATPVGKLDFILPSQGGGYWILANGRIEKWSNGKLTRDLGAYRWNSLQTPIGAVCEEPSGNLVVGTRGEGVFIFQGEQRVIQLNNTTGLSYNTVLSLCSDVEGNLWVGTDGGGLNRVRKQVFDVMESSRGLVVKSVSEDSEGGLWIGYNRAQVEHLKDGETTTYTNTHGLIDPVYVRSILAGGNKQVWAGTLGRGLMRFSDGLFLSARDSMFLRNDREVCALFEDRSGALWVGSSDVLARNDDGTWTTYTGADGLPAGYVRAISQDPKGNIWVGSDGGGLAMLSRGKLVREGAVSKQLSSGSVSCMYWDKDGILWAGTSSGLARYANGSWTWFTNHLGLANDNIGYLIEDNEGFLWMGSHAGLMRVPRSALNAFAEGKTNSLNIPVRFYGKQDGMPTRECSQGSQPAACKGKDGKLWLPTIKGLVSVDPKSITRNTNPPPVIIESVLLDGRLATSDRLRASIPGTMEVPAGVETLDIHFVSLNLSAPDQGQFRYQLEGLESAWTVTPANVRSVHFPRLPHGKYVFHVSACNEDGVWNETGSSLAITVLPPFWKTGWFIALVTFTSLGLIVASVHLISTQRLHRQLAVMRQQEALERERSRIARDLHDQLGANLTQIALLGEMAEEDKGLPEEIEGHARQIGQTARETTRALDEIVWTVNPSNDTLEGLCNYICKYTQDYLGTAEIRYRLDVPASLPATPISPEVRHNVFLVAKEALNNLVKHSGASTAHLRVSVEPLQFTIEIQDDGRGLPPDAENKGRNGLKNMSKRMQEVHGTFAAQSALGKGTTIRFSAPVHPERTEL